jgi:hypothetical protein
VALQLWGFESLRPHSVRSFVRSLAAGRDRRARHAAGAARGGASPRPRRAGSQAGTIAARAAAAPPLHPGLDDVGERAAADGTSPTKRCHWSCVRVRTSYDFAGTNESSSATLVRCETETFRALDCVQRIPSRSQYSQNSARMSAERFEKNQRGYAYSETRPLGRRVLNRLTVRQPSECSRPRRNSCGKRSTISAARPRARSCVHASAPARAGEVHRPTAGCPRRHGRSATAKRSRAARDQGGRSARPRLGMPR